MRGLLTCSASPGLHTHRATPRHAAFTTSVRRKVLHPAPCSAQPPQTQPSTPRLGWQTNFQEQFELEDAFSEGAFGSLNRARNKETGEEVAVKVISKHGSRLTPGSHARTDPRRYLKRVKEEVALHNHVSDMDNVVGLHETFENDDTAFVVLEMCDGGDLEEYMEQKGPMTEQQAAWVAYELLKVLKGCHAADVFHGDVKPANVLLRRENAMSALEHSKWTGPFLALADWGMARYLPGEKPQVLPPRGTPLFLAPEVFAAEYSKAADMWATGMLTYFLISGLYPFWSTHEEVQAASGKQIREVVIRDTSVPTFKEPAFKTASPECIDLLQGILQRNPAKRLTAVEALQHPWFKRHLQGAGVPATCEGDPSQ